MRIVEQYFSQLKIGKRRWRRTVAILTVLSLVVAVGVAWQLRMTGITIANGATCGQEEHQHTEECPVEKVLVCGYGGEEDTTQPTTQPESEPTTEPESEPTTEPVTEPTTEPESEPTTEPVTESTTEPETEPTTEPVTEPTTEPVTEPTTEPTTEPVTEPATQPETEPDSGASTSGTETTPEGTKPSEEPHVHTDDCYELVYHCGYEAHIHVIACYSDTTADVETSVIWEATLPETTGIWAEDLVRVAQSQLGCGESARNYEVAEDGQTRNGITRYGQWYGNPYGEWSGMFVMFCLKYADIPVSAVPWSPGVYNMMRLCQAEGIVAQPDVQMGSAGDLLFLDTDANENPDKLLVVTGRQGELIDTIVGDWENTVSRISLSANDTRILGYISIQAVQADWDANMGTGGDDAPEEGSQEPAIDLLVEFDQEAGTFCLIAEVSNMDPEAFTWQWQYSEDGNDPWIDLEGATDLVWELEDTEQNLNRYYRIQGHRIQNRTRITTFAINKNSSQVQQEGNTVTSGAIAPFSIDKNGSGNSTSYTIDVYAYPIDADGNRITDLPVTELGAHTVNSTSKITVQTWFDDSLGTYKSAYFGTLANVSVDNVLSVWRYKSGNNYYLAYRQTNNRDNNRWLNNSNTSTSLYLRYEPQFTVRFESEGFTAREEKLGYRQLPTLTEPGTWTREGYTLLGWTASGDAQNVYTYEEVMQLPVTQNVTYTAKWAQNVTVSFNLGAYVQELEPIAPMVVTYGTQIPQLPTPVWKNNTVAMAFDGWYLDEGLTLPVPADHQYCEDTILYAKWSPKDEGYYIYFMDFAREGQVPLVLATYSVTEGQTASPYTPGNAPEGKDWNGKWYLEADCVNAYNFAIPVSQMTDYLTGANGRDLYLYPGSQDVCRAIFVTYGTKVDPVTVPLGETIDLDAYAPSREGYEFAGWTLQDGTPVSGVYTLQETTTFYANWNAGYVSFEAILRIENANDTGMTQANILGTWYAKAGSRIRVNSTYTGTGSNRIGTHEVVCVIDDVEYPVYKNAALTQKATLNDVYSTYFIYNNTGTNWTDEVNWDDVYTGGEVPYSTRPVSSAGDTIINFDYMRVRNDIVFTIPNSSAGGYIDIYKLQQNGLITGSVTYTGSRPTTTGQNVSATGVSAGNISWSYTAAAGVDDDYNNYYTLHNMKYGQRIYEVYPVGGSWLTARSAAYHQYKVGSGQLFSSRRQDLTSDFFSGSGRALTPYSLTVEFEDQEYIALMYAVECLEGETPDFVLNGVGYKVDTELCEVVKHTGFFAIKDLDGCEAGINSNGTQNSNNKYYTANTIPYDQRNYAVAMSSAKIGDTSVYTLFAETYWPYYAKFNGVENINTFAKAYIFYYNRLHMNIQFNFGYDDDGDGSYETLTYQEIAYGERIDAYQYGMPGYEQHPLLQREGYAFAGWLDANGFVLEAEDWASMVASGDSENNTMIFIAKWEKISNNIIEYYEDRSSTEPFESHYFDDGELMQYPTMAVYPEGWVWQEYGEGAFQRFDWDVPMYGEYGVQEVRVVNGEERVVNVIRVYGTWDESHTKVVYDPNPPQGGVPGSAPVDPDEYTIWQSEVPVASRGNTANTDPNMVFTGWKLDRDGIVYQPGDHVPVRWPRTMIFTAQWAKAEDVVYLRYDPNGGTPGNIYPNSTGFPYQKNATALVWDNTASDGSVWFTRDGYTFTGWNTAADGSGTSYLPDATITLTDPVTTLYAQWEKKLFTLSVYKVDSESKAPLTGAEFGLYKQENGMFLLVQSFTTGVDGHITFPDLEIDTLYKLVEETPPNGYAIIAKSIFFRVTPKGTVATLTFYDAQNNEISMPQGVYGEYITGTKRLTLTVQNLRGYELPSTGGMGMPLYILCGLILTAIPIVIGFRSRRKCERR